MINTNGLMGKHWFGVLCHFLADAGIFVVAFLVVVGLRFGEEWRLNLPRIWEPVVLGGLVVCCSVYVAGLYSPLYMRRLHPLRLALIIFVCCAVAAIAQILHGYVDFSSRIGRGILPAGLVLAYLGLLIHHLLFRRHAGHGPEDVAFIVGSVHDEQETHLFDQIGNEFYAVRGLITARGYVPEAARWPVLGSIEDLERIMRDLQLNHVVCASAGLRDPRLRARICYLRYSGVGVMTVMNLCEEVYQYIPVELVTQEWLLDASGSPHMLYITKLKRGFDILFALLGLLVLGPVALFAGLLIWVTAGRPILYRQQRAGRFGKPFNVLKLRTMAVNAEKNGQAVWATKNDPRVTRIGHYLRRYRVDEIPQLLNILCGDMSLIGPRPERPEIGARLATVIPFFEERMLVQPGLTGWAQVNYPYGASDEDSRRKFEYDLYYMKHMDLSLDAFILLDTVRTVVRGVLWESNVQDVSATVRQVRTQTTRTKAIVDQASSAAGGGS